MGFWIPNGGFQIQGTGSWILCEGFRIPSAVFRIPKSKIPDSISKISRFRIPWYGARVEDSGNFNPRAVYIKILTWHLGFTDKIANFWRFHCLVSLRRELSARKTKPNIEIRPESLGVMYTERGPLKPLSRSKCANRSIIALLTLYRARAFPPELGTSPRNKIALYIVIRY